jgi:hypothetical protein
VDYAAVRPRLQRVRAFAAAIVAVGFAAGALLGNPSSWLPAALSVAILIHAALRGRVAHSILETVVIDAACIAIGFGVFDHGHVGLIAGVAYLIATAITFGGIVAVIAALGTLAVPFR